MESLTIDLTPEMRARLAQEAERRHLTESAFVEAVVTEALAQAEASVPEPGPPVAKSAQSSADEPQDSEPLSALDAAGDLIGCVRSGIPDLATNPRYLEEAVVKDAMRWRSDTKRSKGFVPSGIPDPSLP